jgi:[NiFe] hydrogenase small subunit
MEKERSFYERLKEKGVSRRDFMKYCTALTATMGLSASFVPKVAEVFAAPAQRPPVVWLHFGECTGCSEALLAPSIPISTNWFWKCFPWSTMKPSWPPPVTRPKSSCTMPSKNTTANSSASSRVPSPPSTTVVTARWPAAPSWRSPKKVVPQGRRHHCHRNLRRIGGIPAAAPNPGGYKGVGDALGIKTLNIPGCPPNPINLVGTVVNYLLLANCPIWTTRDVPCLPTAKPFMTVPPARPF